MNATLTIGEKTYNIRTSALTSTIYRSLFKNDLTIEISKLQNGTDTANLELFKQLAFVMVWQAIPRTQRTTEAMKSLTINDYYDWLEELEESDFYNPQLLKDITGSWLGNQKSVIELKNAQSPQ